MKPMDIDEKTRQEIFVGLDQLRRPLRNEYIFSPLMDATLLRARDIKEGRDSVRWKDLIQFWVAQGWPLVSVFTLRKRLNFLKGAQS